MPDYAELHNEVEKSIQRLLVAETSIYTDEETAEVREFLEAREYGLALETIAAILLEKATPLEAHAVHEIERLAGTMGLMEERAINNVIDAFRRQTYRIAI